MNPKRIIHIKREGKPLHSCSELEAYYLWERNRKSHALSPGYLACVDGEDIWQPLEDILFPAHIRIQSKPVENGDLPLQPKSLIRQINKFQIFYVKRNTQINGPYSAIELRKHLRTGVMRESDLACKFDRDLWEPLLDVLAREELEEEVRQKEIRIAKANESWNTDAIANRRLFPKYSRWGQRKVLVKSSPNKSAHPAPTRLEAWKIVWIILAIVVFVLSGIGSSNRSSRTDGIYESAMKKLNSGHADDLTDAEAQRIHDVLNYKPSPPQIR